MPTEIRFRDLHSGEVQDIIGRVPSWIVRKGTVLIATVVTLALGCAWGIHYPSIVVAPVVIASSDPPVQVYAAVTGQVHWSTPSGEKVVDKDQIVGVIVNGALPEHVAQVKYLADQFVNLAAESMEKSTAVVDEYLANPNLSPTTLTLGAAHPFYREFWQCATAYWQRSREMPQSKAQLRQAKASLLASAVNLQNQIAKISYVLRAPAKGRAVPFNLWEKDNYTVVGQPVFQLVPEVRAYVVMAQLPTSAVGTIKPGQRVQIKLVEYPYQVYGMLPAAVEKVSFVALNNQYTVYLRLQDNLSTLKQRIALRPRYVGTAEIITSDKSLLQRIFERVR